MWWLFWRRKRRDTASEARITLAGLEARDQHIVEMGTQLREVRRRNHFSDMVTTAIQLAKDRP